MARETTRADLRSNPGEDREGEQDETLTAGEVALPSQALCQAETS